MEKYPYFYTDKNNYFSLIPPAGWEGRQEFPEDTRSKVVFSHKDTETGKNAELVILVYQVDVPRSKKSLVSFMENRLNLLKQKSACEIFPLKDVNVAGTSCVQYEIIMNNTKAFNLVGYPAGKLCMNIAFSAPYEVYHNYLQAVLQSLDSMIILKGSMKKNDEILKAQKLIWLQKQAKIMFDNNQYHLARGFIEESLKEFPDDALLHYQMGYALQHLNDSDNALVYYDKAATLKKDFWEPYFRIGQIYHDKGDYFKSESNLIKAIEINPDSIEIMADLAIIYRKTKRTALAIELYESILEKNAKNVPVLFNLGRAYFEEHEYELAKKCFTDCLAIEPDNPSVMVNLAGCLFKEAKFEEAKALCIRALQLDPTIEKAKPMLEELDKLTGR